jgi:hypothetical protein
MDAVGVRAVLVIIDGPVCVSNPAEPAGYWAAMSEESTTADLAE